MSCLNHSVIFSLVARSIFSVLPVLCGDAWQMSVCAKREMMAIKEEHITSIQSGKTHCASFCCASPWALLEGLGYNTSCNGVQWLETAADCKEHEDVVRLIYLYLGQHDIFSAFHCYWRKQVSPCLPRGSVACLYTQWVDYNYSIIM